MKEGEIWKKCQELGVVPQSYRNAGYLFQEWTFASTMKVDIKEFFNTLRQYDFYEIRIDVSDGEIFTATRALY